MTAPLEISRRISDTATSRFSRFEIDTLRALLLARLEEQNAQFVQHEATLAMLTGKSSGDATGRDRAMAALHAYQARATIEDIEDSLARIEGDCYGSCQSCYRSIPFARLEAIPEARYCVACPSASDFPH